MPLRCWASSCSMSFLAARCRTESTILMSRGDLGGIAEPLDGGERYKPLPAKLDRHQQTVGNQLVAAGAPEAAGETGVRHRDPDRLRHRIRLGERRTWHSEGSIA